MTGNIVTDYFLYLAIAACGAGCGYGVWRLLLDKPKQTEPRRPA